MLPINEIDYFLVSNGLPLNGDKKLTIWNFLLSNAITEIPVSIFNWFVNSFSLQNK